MPEPSRQLAAIMFTDIVGYTALMEMDEQDAFRLLDKNRDIQRPIIERHNGKWLKEMGDGILASFTTVSDAVYCAGAIQRACESEPTLFVRIGIHEGEVVFKDEDVFGSGVNIASRLESISQVGGILVSESVYRNIKNKEGITAEFLREETLKNVDEPIKIYQVKVESSESPKQAAGKPLEHSPWLASRKGMVVGAVAVILLVLGYGAYQYRSMEVPSLVLSATEAEISKSIAVLPFANMSNDPEQQYFSDGIMEAILNNLAKIGELKVISRTSVMQYRDTKKTIPQIGEELGVAFLLEGGVQTSEGKVRINAQLIDAVHDKHVWSENYDRELADIFAIQSEIAQKIASELSTVLSPREIEEIQTKGTDNLEAYNLYLMGRYFWYMRTEAGLKRSVDYFEQSLAADPEYALAYSGLADAYLILVAYGLLKDEGFSKAREQALKALEIDPNLAQVHATIGTIARREWRWQEAEIELKRAIELDPNYVMARHWYVEYLDILGHTEEQLKQINRGLEIDPLSFLMQSQLSAFYYNAGELEKALKEAQKLLELDRDDVRSSHFQMFLIYREQGRDDQAFDHLKNDWSIHEPTEKFKDLAEDIYAKKGIDGVLRWWVDLQVNKSPNYPYFIASLYTMLGEKELALDWLEQAFESPPRDLPFMKPDRTFESLRSDPRFIALLEQMGLEADY